MSRTGDGKNNPVPPASLPTVFVPVLPPELKGPLDLPEPKRNELAAKAHAILKSQCSRCHSDKIAAESDFNALSPATMIASVPPVIVPNKPDESELISRILNGSMPPKDQTPRPSQDDFDVLVKWIAAGAPAHVPDVTTTPPQPAPLVAREGDVYDLYSVEFKDADACNKFMPTQSFVLARFGEFMDVLVPDGSKEAHRELNVATDLIWFEYRANVKLPARSKRQDQPLLTRGYRPRSPRPMAKPFRSGCRHRNSGHGHRLPAPGLHYDGRPRKSDVTSVVVLGRRRTVRQSRRRTTRSRALSEWRSRRHALSSRRFDGRPAEGPSAAGRAGRSGTRHRMRRNSFGQRPGPHRLSQTETERRCLSASARRLGAPDFAGVAPAADLIGVRLGKFSMSHEFLINHICAWIDRVAGDRPAVMSCGYGGGIGGRDGRLISDRQLGRMLPDSLPGALLSPLRATKAAIIDTSVRSFPRIGQRLSNGNKAKM